MKRVVVITAIAAAASVLLVIAVLPHTPLKNFLWEHPWWHSFLVAVPGLALGIAGLFLEIQNGRLDSERNEHLRQIAENTERPITVAQQNAATLRTYLRKLVAVTRSDNTAPTPLEIVEVSNDNIVTLFKGADYSSSSAYCIHVRCDELQIVEMPQGSCPIRLRVLKQYGDTVELGQIKNWEERLQPATTPRFAKGGVAYQAGYSKPGSSETRSLCIFRNQEDVNAFLLESSTGLSLVGDNELISRNFMMVDIDYQKSGFQRTSLRTGGSPHPLFIR